MNNFTRSNHAAAQLTTAPMPPDYPDWQSALADAVRDPVELCQLLDLDPSLSLQSQRPAEGFSVLVPRTYLARIHPRDPADPLLRQVLPQAAELAEVAGFQTDPLGEAVAAIVPGLLWKYQGRSLIVSTGACAVHCRFCFRRHFPYELASDGEAAWEPALRRIAAERSIHEVILSGGDPLTLPDQRLGDLIRRLARNDHLQRLRVHTRMPVMIPQRVNRELRDVLQCTRLRPMVVVHVNHPREMDGRVADALGQLVDGGIPVLSQSVLLAGVNDDADVLAELYERLIDLRVMPYYLHQLDPVAGAAHFQVPEPRGVCLIEQLRQRLPGYAVPRYVREVARRASKQPLA